MPHYLDPKHALIFRRIFGEHENLCINLLNSLLPLEPGQRIVELKYQQPEQVTEFPASQNAIIDARCTDNRGRVFVVEMFIHWTEYFKTYMTLNAPRILLHPAKTKGYKLPQPVYALNFVNEIFERTSPEYYHDYKIVNAADTGQRIEGLEFVFIELPKFRPGDKGEKNPRDLWLTFLTKADEIGEPLPALLEEEATREALHYMDLNSYTEAELNIYDRYWNVIRTERSYYLDAIDEGMKKGREKGMKKGLKIGKAKGAEDSLRSVVFHAACAGLPVAQIQAITGLPEDKIQEILSW
jgi:predicted transposase/invertase (TIGR01784 family)